MSSPLAMESRLASELLGKQNICRPNKYLDDIPDLKCVLDEIMAFKLHL